MTNRKVSGLLRATGAVLLGISTFVSLNAQILPAQQSTVQPAQSFALTDLSDLTGPAARQRPSNT
jgi:hypothetical protein